MKESIKNLLGAVAALLLAFFALPLANAQNPPQPAADNSIAPPSLPPDMDPKSPLAQVIRMAQSSIAESVILTYITNSSAPFDLSSAEVTYLNDLGTPTDIEMAMTQRNQELGSSTGTQSPRPGPSGQTQEPQDVTEDYFFGALAQYGTWINMPGYGLCWQPCAAAYNANWTPYCTDGQWIYTDCGWYWLSGYSWGWCVFHYGRWFYNASRGWCWWPSTTWAPSWVFWRSWGSYIGWAPVPPHCYYSQENGLMYNGASIPSDYDFGFGANLFNFVPTANFCDADIERFRLPAAEAAQVFALSQVLADINSNDRIVVNDGIPVNQIAKFTGGDMRSFTIQPEQSVAGPGARGEQILSDGETLAINRPYFNVNVPSSLRQGVWPIPAQVQPVAHQPPSVIVNEIPYSYPSADNQDDNSVIYMDSADQGGPPVPTVTTDGPQDYPANAPVAGPPAQSYWVVSPGAPPPVDASSAYMSPRSQSHERWRHKVPQPANHQEFNPSNGGSRPAQHQGNHAPGPAEEEHSNPHPPAESHSSEPAHAAPSSPPPQSHSR